MENFVMISKLLTLELVKCFICSYPETPRVGGQEGLRNLRNFSKAGISLPAITA
jgi:hypothetical protein